MHEMRSTFTLLCIQSGWSGEGSTPNEQESVINSISRFTATNFGGERRDAPCIE
jgi:hypothetical protein